jgi:cerevisin
MLSQAAGLLAYLLSIYPSTTFNPKLLATKSLIPSSILETAVQAYPAFVSLQRVYSLARAVLPDSITNFFPSFEDISTAIPAQGYPTLSPKDLKDALLDLSSEEMLTLVPDDTPNLLIFNNATSLK